MTASGLDLQGLEAQLLEAPSLELWEQARRLYKEAGGSREASLLRLYGLASALCFAPGEARFEKGRSLLREASRRFEGAGQPREAATARVYLATAERRQGRADQAAELLEEALGTMQWTEDRPMAAQILHALGLTRLEQRRGEEAEGLRNLLEAATARAPEERWRWHHLRARLLEEAGDLRLAARELSRARALTPQPEPAGALQLLLDDARRLKGALEKTA